MSTITNREKATTGNSSLTRRRFVQGTALIGVAASIGVRPGFAAGFTELRIPEVLRGTEFDLTVKRQTINLTGRQSWSNSINGGVPGPVLRWQEGDVVNIHLKNEMTEVTGFHWHGIILPNDMDGVPGLEFAGIQPGETHHYHFPVLQSGTYWYHSHMGYQEQKGAYGALIVDPLGPPTIQADREHIILLSDWTDDDPTTIASNFKQMSSYYNYKQRTTATDIADVRNSGLMATIKERARALVQIRSACPVEWSFG